MATRLEITLMVVPAFAYVVVMWLKFGQITPPVEKLVYGNDQALIDLRNSNHGTLTGPRFILTNLAQYLRPDSLSISSVQPWLRFNAKTTADAIILPPISRSGTMVNHVVSITNTMFVQLVLTFSAVVLLLKNAVRTRTVSLSLVFLVAAGAGVGPTLMTYSSLTRYLGDFYPVLAVGSIFGLVALATTTSMSVDLKRTVLNIAIVLAGISSFIWYILQLNRWV